MRLIIIIFSCFFIICTTTKPQKQSALYSYDSNKIKLYLAPMIINAHLDSLEQWPDDHRKETKILKKIAAVHNSITASLKSGECFKKFIVVQDFEQPAIRVSIVLKSCYIENDSLCIALQIEMEQISDGNVQSYSLDSYAWASKKFPSEKKSYIIRLFDHYYDNFPYSSITGIICSH